MATTQQKIDFYNELGPLARQVAIERGFGNAFIWTCMAQAADESNYGTSPIMRGANAFFGIKASSSWVKAAKYGGLVYNSKTKECYDGKSYTNISACFRAYKNMLDSIRDYADLISGSRYKESLAKTTVRDAITVIKNGGYATAPDYIATICNFYKAHQSLIESYNVGIVPPAPIGFVNPYIEPRTTLTVGSVGAPVKWLQTQLNHKGYNLAVDGHFGPKTLEAVTAFQAEHNLEVDGRVGPATRRSLLS